MRTIVAVGLAFGVLGAYAEPESWHELAFSYEDHVLTLERATPLPLMRKAVRSPSEHGALAYLSYEMEWRDAGGRSLLAVPVHLPLGVRVPLPEADTPDEMMGGIIPTTGYFVVRVPGPDPALLPTSIHMTSPPRPMAIQSETNQAVLPNFPVDMTFNLPDVALIEEQIEPLAAGPQGYEKIRHTGPDDNRFVLVVVGDGYTADDLADGTYSNHVTSHLEALRIKPPWNILWEGLNIYRIDMGSNERGADYEDAGPPHGTLKDTYLNASFWFGGGAERLLYIDATGRSRAFSAANNYIGAGRWDEVLVLVNSTKYGGGGGSVAVASVHSAGPDLIAHELGHSFVRLADEYDNFDPTTYTGPNPVYANVDTSVTNPKWKVWIEPGTPLPTPSTTAYSLTVGTFEGAYYKMYGIYRPSRTCKMRSMLSGFCPVCREQHLLKFFDLVELVDSVTPGTGSVVQVHGATNLMVEILPVTGMTNRWVLNGQAFGSGGPTLSVTTAQLPLPTNTISAIVSYSSPAIRSRPIEKSYSWTLANRGETLNGTPHWWLVSHGLDTVTGDAYDDGDGMQAWQEYIADTNPTNSSHYFHIAEFADSPLPTLRFDSSTGRLYSLQGRTNLLQGVWSDIPGQTLRPGVGGTMTMTDTNMSPSGIYRLKVTVP